MGIHAGLTLDAADSTLGRLPSHLGNGAFCGGFARSPRFSRRLGQAATSSGCQRARREGALARRWQLHCRHESVKTPAGEG